MGQMGNSDEATMPDDLPFEMADLIVVGGKGEPMKFANGGFVPEMQTLETAPVPTMGGGTSTGTQTPIVYDDFMKTPVVTMQEYRDANGNSIIITSVNGKATTEIPAGTHCTHHLLTLHLQLHRQLFRLLIDVATDLLLVTMKAQSHSQINQHLTIEI